MLSIERRILRVKVQNHFFVKDQQVLEPTSPLVAYTHSFKADPFLSKYETLQLDLSKEPELLLREMNQTTRRQIKRAEEKGFAFEVIEYPTYENIIAFQTFYNEFARNKNTFLCDSYHLQTMELLRQQGALKLTYMTNDQEEPLCYRVYIVDKPIAMNLYSASHFRMAETSEDRKVLGQTNRLLIWESMKWLKKKGFNLYDFGGLTNDDNIRKFKLGFGGEIKEVYFGYKANSLTGYFLMKLRDLKIGLLKARDIS